MSSFHKEGFYNSDPPSYYLSDRIKKLKLTQLEIVKFKPKQV